MKRIFWGMLLIMIDFGITNGAAFFDLLPDLLGVLLCLWGMAQLNDVWHRSKICGFLCFYAVYTLADLIICLLGIATSFTMTIMPLISNALMLYLTFMLTAMIQHMEKDRHCLYGKDLRISWILLCVTQCVTSFVFLANDVDKLLGVFGSAQWLAAMITIFLMVSFLISTALWLSYLFLSARQHEHGTISNGSHEQSVSAL